jgi:hypothetical protein
MVKEIDMKISADLVTPEMIVARLDEWDARTWDDVRGYWMEYRAALGDEATKTFKEFAWGIAAQNLLFDALEAA